MFVSFLALLSDPTFQGLVLSPLIGLVLGVILNPYLPSSKIETTSPGISFTSHTIHDNRITINNYYQKEIQQKEKNPVGWEIILLCIGAAFLLIFGYLAYSDIIFRIANIITSSIFFFSLTFVIISVKHRLLYSLSWWTNVLIPYLGMCFVIFLLSKLQSQLNPKVVSYAKEAGLINFFNFGINTLNHLGRIFYFSQSVALILTIVLHLYCFQSILYYMAFMDFQISGNRKSFWQRLALFVDRRSFKVLWEHIMTLLFLSTTAYFFASTIFTKIVINSAIKF